MSKAILILDEMPNCCYNCMMLYTGGIAEDGYKRWACWAAQDESGFRDLSMVDKPKPDWCPLRPLPARKEKMDYLASGWNACLDAIEEGE